MIFRGGKKLLNTKCVFWFSLQLLSETFLILRRNGRDIINNVYRSACTVPLFLSYFNETWLFRQIFEKVLKYRITYKWGPSGSMRTDRQTDRRTWLRSQCCERDLKSLKLYRRAASRWPVTCDMYRTEQYIGVIMTGRRVAEVHVPFRV